MLRKLSAALLVLALLAAPVAAQPGADPPAAAKPSPKSAAVARSLSLLIPLVTVAAGGAAIAGAEHKPGPGSVLVFAGAVFGPATGLWYAGRPGGLGMGVRASALLLGLGAWVSYEDADNDGTDDRHMTTMKGLMVITASAVIVSAIYDSHAAGKAAERWNVDHGLTVTPTVMSTGQGRATGLMMSGRF